MTVRKGDLVEQIAQANDISKNEASRQLDNVLGALQSAFGSGNDVTLPGFGSFVLRERAARTGRNPQTGAEIQIAASKTVAFKPGKGLKEAL